MWLLIKQSNSYTNNCGWVGNSGTKRQGQVMTGFGKRNPRYHILVPQAWGRLYNAVLGEQMWEIDVSHVDKQKLHCKHHLAGAEEKINFEKEVGLGAQK
jgi:hypothetical protein